MNKPLGGKLIDQVADAKTKKALLNRDLPILTVANEKIVECWDIATGAYSPLHGFLGKTDLLAVLRTLHLANGIFWPIPVTLDISAKEKAQIADAEEVFLVSATGEKFAVMTVAEVYPFPKELFEQKVFGTHDEKHPGVRHTRESKEFLVGGTVRWIGKHFDAIKPSFTPQEIRAKFSAKKWKRIVAFHTRNVPHHGHEHVMREGLRKTDGILVQPLVGRKKNGDFRNEVVASAYRYFEKSVLPRGKSILSFLPYNAYYAGPREALLTAVIRKNFGCTHFIVGRDHTGVGDFYTVREYARIIAKYEPEMGIKIFHFGKAFYCAECKGTAFEDTCPHAEKYRVHPSGTLIRKMLIEGKVPPADMMRPEIARILLKEKDLFVK